jgi:hypothetical protein
VEFKSRDLRGLALSKDELVHTVQMSEEEKVLAEKLEGVVGEVVEIKSSFDSYSLNDILIPELYVEIFCIYLILVNKKWLPVCF